LAHPITRVYIGLAAVAGLWLGLIYAATDSLLSATVAHWITNGVMMEWLLRRHVCSSHPIA
ncbi:MAG: CPBP family glutamic-type intramembrane protease, partial [Verrucomicrobiia bacterium]